MQSYQKEHEKAKQFAKKISPISELKHHVMVVNFSEELAERTYARRNLLLFHLSVVVAFISQALSLWSSYASVEKVVSIKIKEAQVLFLVVCFLLAVIEVLKYALVHTALKDCFSVKPIYPYIVICFALVISLFSVFLSIQGSTELAKDKVQEERLTTEQVDKEAELKSLIAEIQNGDSYKDVVWSGGGVSSKVLSKVGKDLIQKRESELDSLRKTYQHKTNTFKAEQAQAMQNYNYFFAIWEVLFLFATIAQYNYKRNCVIENELLCEPTNEVVREPTLQDANEREPARTENGVVRSNTAKQPEPHELSEVQNEVTANQHCEVPLRSEVRSAESEPIGEVPNEPTLEDSEADFLALIDKFTNGKRAYLEKYKEVVKTILECERRKIQATAIEKICVEKHTIGKTTYYNIVRIIRNTK